MSKCVTCGSTEHTAFYCPKKPRKPLPRSGKISRQWNSTRQKWIRDNPEPWACYICFKPLDASTLTLDHLMSRSRHPELRFDVTNLAPCCWKCNSLKGSKNFND